MQAADSCAAMSEDSRSSDDGDDHDDVGVDANDVRNETTDVAALFGSEIIISSSNRHQPVKTTHEPEILILQDDDLDLNLSEDPSLAQHSAMHSISIDITSDDVHEEHENFSSVFRHRSVLPLPPKTPKESVSFGGGEVFQRVGTSGGGQGVGMLPPRTPAAAVVIAGDWRVTCDV